ncbi:unnamed protein product [Cladocopium goreaui]|uniref:Uncharacterized protein n=1 Tax=Cladocopium goreaui TaxID=2562237 RepID=A0A9P1GL45_9DINO|nr:unnamed protein product [Cladocopium goreaui]
MTRYAILKRLRFHGQEKGAMRGFFKKKDALLTLHWVADATIGNRDPRIWHSFRLAVEVVIGHVPRLIGGGNPTLRLSCREPESPNWQVCLMRLTWNRSSVKWNRSPVQFRKVGTVRFEG